MKRRTKYGARIHQNSYFTIRALTVFLDGALDRHVQRGHLVADLGCGESPLKAVIEARGATHFGLDIEAHSPATRVVASVTQIPLRENSFDIAVCTEVLEHVYNASGAVAEIARILRPGGIAIITTPFFYPLHEEPYDFGRPTPYFLRQACREAGLDIESLEPLGDEMQVAASVLDAACTLTTLKGPLHQLWRGARVVIRFSINCTYGALSLLLRKSLPRKACLGYALIARKSPVAPLVENSS